VTEVEGGRRLIGGEIIETSPQNSDYEIKAVAAA
jgi:hypothetical protein